MPAKRHIDPALTPHAWRDVRRFVLCWDETRVELDGGRCAGGERRPRRGHVDQRLIEAARSHDLDRMETDESQRHQGGGGRLMGVQTMRERRLLRPRLLVFVLRGAERLVLAVDVRSDQPQERDDQRRGEDRGPAREGPSMEGRRHHVTG